MDVFDSTMSKFPPELRFEIFLLLPPKDLIVCMCVCKAWNATIRHRHFIKAHFQRSAKTNSHRTLLMRKLERNFYSVAFFDDDTFGREAVELKHPWKPNFRAIYILGFCHGLLFIRTGNSKRDFTFWNPSTKKLRKIPFTTIEKPSDMKKRMAGYGFGYDSTNDDDKLVRMMQFTNRVDGAIVSSDVKVYNLKSNSWKKIQNLPSNDRQCLRYVVFLNGALTG